VLCKTLAQQTNRKNSFVAPDAFSRLKMANKCVCGSGSAPDRVGGAYSAPVDPLAGLSGPTVKGMGREWEKRKEKGEAMGRREGVASPLRGKRPWFHAWLVPGYTLNFHLVDGLLSNTAAHEVRRAGVLTCGSCHLERSMHLVCYYKKCTINY